MIQGMRTSARLLSSASASGSCGVGSQSSSTNTTFWLARTPAIRRASWPVAERALIGRSGIVGSGGGAGARAVAVPVFSSAATLPNVRRVAQHLRCEGLKWISSSGQCHLRGVTELLYKSANGSEIVAGHRCFVIRHHDVPSSPGETGGFTVDPDVSDPECVICGDGGIYRSLRPGASSDLDLRPLAIVLEPPGDTDECVVASDEPGPVVS